MSGTVTAQVELIAVEVGVKLPVVAMVELFSVEVGVYIGSGILPGQMVPSPVINVVFVG
jgi:hypothetical protein